MVNSDASPTVGNLSEVIPRAMHVSLLRNDLSESLLAYVAGDQAVKYRAGKRPPARFGLVFQILPTSLHFVIRKPTKQYIFYTLAENYHNSIIL